MRVRVAVSPVQGVARERAVELAEGACAGDALRASGFIDECLGGVPPADGDVGIWGRACGLEAALQDGDRVEVYRPLAVDPKEARRRRAGRRRR